MTIDLTRRGFLAGLFGTAVVAVLPKAAPAAAPLEEIEALSLIKPPSGMTWQWVATHVMGQPDPGRLEARLANGWRPVVPSAHPGMPSVDIEEAINSGGFVLMQKPTAEVMAAHRAELDRVLGKQGLQHVVETPEGLEIRRTGRRPFEDQDPLQIEGVERAPQYDYKRRPE